MSHPPVIIERTFAKVDGDSGDWEDTDADRIATWEEEYFRIERSISQARARQVVLLRQPDRHQIDTAEGHRTMADWVSANADVSHQTSSRLMTVARADDREVDEQLAAGRWTIDRASALVRLRQAGATAQQFNEAAERYSLGRLYGLLDRLRHLTPADEKDLFCYRYLVIQPELDESAFKLWGQCLPPPGESPGEVARRGDEPSRRG